MNTIVVYIVSLMFQCLIFPPLVSTFFFNSDNLTKGQSYKKKHYILYLLVSFATSIGMGLGWVHTFSLHPEEKPAGAHLYVAFYLMPILTAVGICMHIQKRRRKELLANI